MKKLREERGLSLEKAGRAYGVKPKQVELWEAENHVPRKYSRLRICEVYSISLEYLESIIDKERKKRKA